MITNTMYNLQQHSRWSVNKPAILAILARQNYLSTAEFVSVYLLDQNNNRVGYLDFSTAYNYTKNNKLNLQYLDIWSSSILDYKPVKQDLYHHSYLIETLYCTYQTANSDQLWRKLNHCANHILQNQIIKTLK